MRVTLWITTAIHLDTQQRKSDTLSGADCSSILLLAQLWFLEALLQQITAYTPKKLPASTTLGSGVFFGERRFDIIVSRQPIIQTFNHISRPLRFYRSRPNKVETKHPPDCGMAFSRYIMNMEGCLRGMQDGVIGS